MTIDEALAEATTVLTEARIPDGAKEASSLLTHILGRDRAFTIAHPEYHLAATERSDFENLVQRRARHEPFQYIVGRKEFYGLEFEVTPDVFIPRPETELLVETAIKRFSEQNHPHFCEVGVGSGCISVSILHEIPAATATSVDISEKALEIARRNALKHNVMDRLSLLVSDVFKNVDERSFDAVLSNPPYVPFKEFQTLQAEVRDHEPSVALTDGSEGLSIIESIAAGAVDQVKIGGSLLVEFGFGQADSVQEILNATGWTKIELIADLQGIPRLASARRPG
jgi:release factor glutamine methyltransferase